MRGGQGRVSPARGVLLAGALLLGACAGGPAPTTGIPAHARANDAPMGGAAAVAPLPPELPRASQIRVPEGALPVLRLRASGNQIFRCEARGKGFEWTFRLPEADLTDEAGNPAGRHGANYSFEHPDGSRVVGTIVAHDPAPHDVDIAWLLIAGKPFGKGTLGDIAWIQRVDTEGGMPPVACDAGQSGQVLRVPFSATFVFYR
jgi:hypothetical protein